jgi:RNA polymerase sigma factor (sigma-70 family)
MANISDLDLVNGIKENDTACLKALVDIYAGRLFSIARSFGLSHQDSEEIVDDSLCKIVNKINQFDVNKGSKLSSWIVRITINTAIDKLRKLKDPHISQSLDDREARGIQDTEALWQEPPHPVSKIGQISQKILSQALDNLSETDQTILRCRAGNIPHKNIAKLLNKSTGAVKTGHSRALIRLKNEYFSMLETFEDQKLSMDVKTFLDIEAVNERTSN